MLQIPDKVVGDWLDKLSHPISDVFDRLNSVFTTGVFIFFVLFSGAKQYFGTPIQCMIPQEFAPTWISFFHEYCFIHSTYVVRENYTTELDADLSKMDHVYYYQWVPYIFMAQAAMFYIPTYFFSMVYSLFGMDFATAIAEAEKLRSLNGNEHQEVLTTLTDYIYDRLRLAGPCCLSNCQFGIYMAYVFTKWLFVANTIAQLYFLNVYIGNGNMLFGYDILMSLIYEINWRGSSNFPRVTNCSVVLQVENINRYTAQCILMQNILNEKLFMIIWFWIVFLCGVNIISALYRTAQLIISPMRTYAILNYLQADDLEHGTYQNVRNFSLKVLKADGFLLITFISERCGLLVAKDIIYNLYCTSLNSKFYLPHGIAQKSKGLETVDEMAEETHPSMLSSLDPSMCSTFKVDESPFPAGQIFHRIPKRY